MNTNEQKMNIEYKDINTISPYALNAKKHPEDQVAKIAKSIKEFGWGQPIVVDKKGVIIVGHGRYEAAKSLSLEKVPVLVLNVSEEKAKAYRLADNKLNESEWDMKLVVDELREIPEELIEVTGFSKDLLVDPDEKEDDVPEGVGGAEDIKQGDIWVMGQHRIMCGDSTSIEDTDKLCHGMQADMIFTDPPYNVDYKGSGDKTSDGIMNDKMDSEDFNVFLDMVFKNLYPHTKKGAGIYIFHSEKTAHQFRHALIQNGFDIKNPMVWNKPNAGLGMGDYRPKYEPFFYCNIKGGKAQFYGDRTNTNVWDFQDDEEKLVKWARKVLNADKQGRTTVWTISRDKVNQYVHPTQKPVELIEFALKNSSKEGDMVLDLFAGSGSTTIACEKLGRLAYSMELDPKYVATVLTRYAQYTGTEPIREKDGMAWSEIYNWRAGMDKIELSEDI